MLGYARGNKTIEHKPPDPRKAHLQAQRQWAIAAGPAGLGSHRRTHSQAPRFPQPRRLVRLELLSTARRDRTPRERAFGSPICAAFLCIGARWQSRSTARAVL